MYSDDATLDLYIAYSERARFYIELRAVKDRFANSKPGPAEQFANVLRMTPVPEIDMFATGYVVNSPLGFPLAVKRHSDIDRVLGEQLEGLARIRDELGLPSIDLVALERDPEKALLDSMHEAA